MIASIFLLDHTKRGQKRFPGRDRRNATTDRTDRTDEQIIGLTLARGDWKRRVFHP
jgi:hypothetical protein